MKKNWVIGIIAMVTTLVVGAAYAQTSAPTEPSTGYGAGMMGGRGGYGMMGQGIFQARPTDGSYGPMHEYMIEAFAEAFGISVEDLESRLEAGESLWQIAEFYGISLEDFKVLRAEAHATALQQAVEAGILTQEQASWMNQRMSGRGFAGSGCNGMRPDSTD